MITILGPTATGKTALTARLALSIEGEIISADSRQVYRGMDLGTGKDLQDYLIGDKAVSYHLIDILDAGEEYNVYRFVVDFERACSDIRSRGKEVILCGGTGMYLEAVLKGYNLVMVPENLALRKELETIPTNKLIERLLSLGPVHATSDLKDRNRMIIAIEKREYYKEQGLSLTREGSPSLVFGLTLPREIQREKITKRLHQRLKEGMVAEVEKLLNAGVDPSQLLAYGLEYKWITLYLTGSCGYDEMVASLNTAIHRFAKRQVTWFRKMERSGTEIHWIDATKNMEEKLDDILVICNRQDLI